MAHKMIDIWCCDRCAVTQDKPFKNPHIRTPVYLDIKVTTNVGEVLRWKDLCPACNDQLDKVIRGLVIG